MNINIKSKIQLYQITVIFSLAFALLGFTYNVWRMELTEQNNNIRTACFEILLELSELEQLVYTAHYDNNLVEGSPRKGWVKVGLIVDLSILTTDLVENRANQLKTVWAKEWSNMVKDEDSVKSIIKSIDSVRSEIKMALQSLE